METISKRERFGVRVCLCNFFIKDNESSIESENRGWKMMKGCRHIGETAAAAGEGECHHLLKPNPFLIN